MGNDMLKMLVKMACADGNVTPEEYEQLKNKAKEINIAEPEVDALIKEELQKKKITEKSGFETTENDEKLSSGFVTEEKAQLSSGFLDKNKNDIESVVEQSGFLSEGEGKDINSGFISDNQNAEDTHDFFTHVSLLSEQGAMSLVYKGKRHGRWVIIKRLKPKHTDNAKYRTLFFQEFENAYHFNHPNIVSLYDKGKDENGPYYYMEYIDGRPLKQLITKNGITDGKLIKNIALQTLEALAYVHKQQVYHRDLKPENILITYKGDNVKILDFGLALSDDFEDDLIKVGTPRYAAPEQRQKSKNTDQRADIYAFGLILLEMLTGGIDYLEKAVRRSGQIMEVIAKCIEVLPEKRFESVSEITEKLEKIEIKDLAPSIATNPTHIDFGTVNSWKAQQFRLVYITNSGFGEMQWKAVTNSPEISISIRNQALKIELKPLKKSKDVNATVEILSNGGNVEIPVKAFVYNPLKKVVIWASVCIVALLLSFFTIKKIVTLKKTEREYWQEVISENSLNAYNEYLTEYPKGKYKNEAFTRRDRMQKEENLWQRAQKKQSPEVFSEYIMAYPVGKYTEEAEKLRERLLKDRQERKEDALWRMAQRLNNIEFYSDYIQKYPNGQYVLKATTQIEELKKEQIKGKDKIDPNNRPTDIVKEFIEMIGNKKYGMAYEKTKNPNWGSFNRFSSRDMFGSISKTKIISIILLSDEGRKASVIAEYYAFDFENNTEKEYRQKYQLAVFEGEWKITGAELIKAVPID